VATRDDRPSFPSPPRMSEPQPGLQEARGETALGHAIAAAGRRTAPRARRGAFTDGGCSGKGYSESD
jgi:hypothetical protein